MLFFSGSSSHGVPSGLFRTYVQGHPLRFWIKQLRATGQSELDVCVEFLLVGYRLQERLVECIDQAVIVNFVVFSFCEPSFVFPVI